MRSVLTTISFVLSGLAAASASASACEVLLFKDFRMGGQSRRLTEANPDLRSIGFDRQASSIVVVSGIWELYYSYAYGQGRPVSVVGPGSYGDVRQIKLPNDSLSSLRCRG